jgi:hypothetical protein|tara:strand:+ start:49 stop:624 length:576 start_codon:yes stop_codon:yes gene_type:complete
MEAIKSLIKAQGEMGKAIKGATNPHFKSKYADLESVINATMAAFHGNGFGVIQRCDKNDNGHFVETQLIHTSGHIFDSRVYLVLGKNDMQGLGSALTYARRYALLGLAGIAPEDDDANAAVANKQQAPAPQGFDIDFKFNAALEFYDNCNAERFEANENRFKKLIENTQIKEWQYDELIAAHNKRKKELSL